MKQSNTVNIDSYIAGFPTEVQQMLKKVRATIKKAAPNAEEKMSYGIPTFTLQGNLVHFAGYKKHIGFYPAPSGITAFSKELSAYTTSKGAVQFPIDQPLPLALIAAIVKFRVKENLAKADSKMKSKTNVDFMDQLSAPAKRALRNSGINSLKNLARYSEAEILSFHGMGKTSLPKLRNVLRAAGLSFKKK